MATTNSLQKKAFWKRFKDERDLQIMAILGLVWMLIFSYIPMYGLIIAFKKNFSITQSLFSIDFLKSAWAGEYGFHHFIAFVKDSQFGNVMTNTLGMSLLKLVICFPMPIIFALFLNELKSPGFKKWVQTISYLPHFLSWVVLGGILTTWLAKDGFINEILIKMDLINEGKTYLAYPQYFWGIVVVSDLWKEIGWNAIIYLAAITGIDPQLYEAAKIDGAGRASLIKNITLPSIAGTIAILFILNVGGLLNANFDQVFVLYNPLNAPRSNVIDLYVYSVAMRSMRFSYAAAIGLFKSVISIILLIIANRVTKRISDISLF